MPSPEISRGRMIIDRWRVLAEARLDYLTELYETGRWQRYFTERAFLENIREAKAAAEAWRVLASQESLADNTPVDLSWLDARRPGVVAQPRRIELLPSSGAEKMETAPAWPVPIKSDIRIAARAEVDHAFSKTTGSAPGRSVPPLDGKLGLDLATLKQRYPLLRNVV